MSKYKCLIFHKTNHLRKSYLKRGSQGNSFTIVVVYDECLRECWCVSGNDFERDKSWFMDSQCSYCCTYPLIQGKLFDFQPIQ